MDNISRFGVFLPTYIWDDDGPERARNIVAFARRVEELGFDSLWVTDHLLSAQHFYSASFLEPLSTLAVAAGATERVRLGTSVLVLPTRQPVVLAKELSTLQYLSDNRFILGAGVGWNQAEFRATGGDKSQRGRRTDEILDIAIPLHGGRDGHLPRPVLPGRRGVDRAAPERPARAVDRRRLAAGQREVARQADARPGGQGAHPQGRGLDPAPDLPARGPGARLGGDPGRDARARPRPRGVHRRARELHALRRHGRRRARRGASSTRRS